MKVLINYEVFNSFPFLYNPTEIVGKDLKFYDGDLDECILVSFPNDEIEVSPNILLPYASTTRDTRYIESEVFEKIVIKERARLIQDRAITEDSKLFFVNFAKGEFIYDVDGKAPLVWFTLVPPRNTLGKLAMDYKTRNLYRIFNTNYLCSVAMAASKSHNLLIHRTEEMSGIGASLALELFIGEIGHELPTDKVAFRWENSTKLMSPCYEDIEYGDTNLDKLYQLFNQAEI